LDLSVRLLSLLLLAATWASADFSYEQRSQFTGGAMAQMMKMASTFSKKAGLPTSTWTYLKGNKIAYVTGTNTQVFDIDAETITQIDSEKKTYSVTTFAQMREAMAKLTTEGKKDVDTRIQVDAKETGRAKAVAGQNTNEWLVSFIYAVKDKKGKQTAEMETQSSMWLATNVAGWKEFSAAQQKLGQKMATGPGGASPFGGGMAGAQPGMGESWAALAEKMSKMNGVPMLQIVRMGQKGQLPPASTMGEAPAPGAPKAEAESKPKAGDLIGGALGGRLGGLGRRRKDSSEPREDMPQKAEGARGGEGGLLMEMTIETIQMSSMAVDAAKLAVPAGYQQVESDILKAANRRR
jgi:hypothetical protein